MRHPGTHTVTPSTRFYPLNAILSPSSIFDRRTTTTAFLVARRLSFDIVHFCTLKVEHSLSVLKRNFSDVDITLCMDSTSLTDKTRWPPPPPHFVASSTFHLFCKHSPLSLSTLKLSTWTLETMPLHQRLNQIRLLSKHPSLEGSYIYHTHHSSFPVSVAASPPLTPSCAASSIFFTRERAICAIVTIPRLVNNNNCRSL